jgi:hypothetical protein
MESRTLVAPCRDSEHASTTNYPGLLDGAVNTTK